MRAIPLLLVLLAASLVFAGEDPPAPPGDKPAPEAKPGEAKPGEAKAGEEAGKKPFRIETDPKAEKIFEAAVAEQGPEKYAAPGAIENLTVKIAARVYDYTKDPPEKVSMDVRRHLALEPTRFRTEWKTAVGSELYGLDEKGRFWSASYDQNGRLVNSRFLFGDDHKQTVERIEGEIAETNHLLGLFFLANLRGEDAVFKLFGQEKLKIGKTEHVCHVIGRVNWDPKSSDPPVKLWIEEGTHHLLMAEAFRPDQRNLIFVFRYDEAEQPRVKGVLFPLKIELRDRAIEEKESRPISAATVEENGIDFNSKLPPALFTRPK